MGVQLNIKDERTVQLARELAHRLGKSVTDTIREALEDKARLEAAQRQAKIDRLNALVDEFQKDLPADVRGMTSRQVMDELYDDDGLPR
jgi:hypothetical protein